MEDNMLTVSLRLQDWNLILGALSLRPFGEVAALVGEINKQAASQLNRADMNNDAQVEALAAE